MTAEATAKPRTGGKALERLVIASQRGAVLHHVAQAARRTAKGVIAVRGPCDFLGTLDGGRSIVFDAKECASKTAFDASTDHLPQHQVNQLIDHGRVGAVSGLLILATASDKVYWLDWRRLVQRNPTYPWETLLSVCQANRAIPWDYLARCLPIGRAT